jgi:TP901 family phage tail tape measure protein
MAVRQGGKNTEIIAAEIRVNGEQFRRELQRQARGIDALSRKTESATQRMGRAWSNLGQRMRNARQGMGGGGVMARGGGMVRGMLGMAGVFGAGALIQETKNFEAALTDMMITGNKTSDWLNKVRDQVTAVSNATGRGRSEVAGYMQSIITQTGDADAALSTLSQMGEVALATGANMEALGGTYVKLGGAMRVQANEAKAAMNILRAQEKLGSVTMANISGQFGQIASLAPSFGKAGEGLGGVRALGGLFQIGARGFAVDQPGMAATATASFLERLSRDPKKIEKALGIKIRGEGGEFLELPEVFRRIGEAGAKDRAKFAAEGTGLFGLRGYKVAQQLQAAAIGGWGQQQGIYGSAQELFQAGGEDVIAKDAAKRRQSVAFQWDQAMVQMQNSMHKHMLPVLQSAVKYLPDFAKALGFVLENSRMLIALWIGWKGMMFFKRLMAPLRGAGGAGAAGMAAGMGGMAGGYGAGRAPVLGPWGGAGGVGGSGRGGRGKPGWFQRQGGWGAVGGGAAMALPMVPFAIEAGMKLAGGREQIAQLLGKYKAIEAQNETAQQRMQRNKILKGFKYESWYESGGKEGLGEGLSRAATELFTGRAPGSLKQSTQVLRYRVSGRERSMADILSKHWQYTTGRGGAFMKMYQEQIGGQTEKTTATVSYEEKKRRLEARGKTVGGALRGPGEERTYWARSQEMDLNKFMGGDFSKKGHYQGISKAKKMLQMHVEGVRHSMKEDRAELGKTGYQQKYGALTAEQVAAATEEGSRLAQLIKALEAQTSAMERADKKIEIKTTVNFDPSTPAGRLKKTAKKKKTKSK